MREHQLPDWQGKRQSERQGFAASKPCEDLASSGAICGFTGTSCAFAIARENFSDSRSGLFDGGSSQGVEVIRWKSSRTR